MWSCHTLRNELLGTASVSLWNLLKSGGKCMSIWPGQSCCGSLGLCVESVSLMRAGVSLYHVASPYHVAPAGNKALLCAGCGAGCDSSQICVSWGARAVWKHKPSAICCYLLPFVVTRVWLWQQLLHKDAHSRLSHGSYCAGLEKAYSVFSKQSSASHRTQSWYGVGREGPLPCGE